MALEDEIRRLAIAIERYTALAFPRRIPPDIPDLVTVGESRVDMTDFLHKKQSFNSLAGTDYKQLKYSVTGAREPVSAEFTVNEAGDVVAEDGSAAVVEFQVQEDATYTRSWSLIDNAGNETEVKSTTHVAADDFAGTAPDEIGDLVTTGEHSE